MYINLTERLVILPRAVAPKGVHLVAHRHRSVVDPAGPAFQVHWPAQHSAQQQYVLSSSLCRIPWSQRRWPWWRKQREVQHLWARRSGSGGQGEHKGEPSVLAKARHAAFCVDRLKSPHIILAEWIFSEVTDAYHYSLFMFPVLCALSCGAVSKYRTAPVLMHHITDQRNLPI